MPRDPLFWVRYRGPERRAPLDPKPMPDVYAPPCSEPSTPLSIHLTPIPSRIVDCPPKPDPMWIGQPANAHCGPTSATADEGRPRWLMHTPSVTWAVFRLVGGGRTACSPVTTTFPPPVASAMSLSEFHSIFPANTLTRVGHLQEQTPNRPPRYKEPPSSFQAVVSLQVQSLLGKPPIGPAARPLIILIDPCKNSRSGTLSPSSLANAAWSRGRNRFWFLCSDQGGRLSLCIHSGRLRRFGNSIT
jgi:hypothetical protein